MVLNYGIAKNGVVSIRSKSNLKSELADEILFGMTVKLLEEKSDGWYYVETSYDYNGYINKNDLYLYDEEGLKWDKEANYIIDWKVVDVLKEPKYRSYPIKQLTKGSIIKLSGEKIDNWVEVIFPDGEKGWIRKEWTVERIRNGKKVNEEILRKNIVNTALSYLGTQYRWGGKSPLGIDCSGLCSISYLINGVVIYRDSEIKEGYSVKKISRENMRPGDLIYYSGHITMYIGNDKYIHSTGSSGGVVINSLNPEDIDYREDLVDMKEIGSIF